MPGILYFLLFFILGVTLFGFMREVLSMKKMAK